MSEQDRGSTDAPMSDSAADAGSTVTIPAHLQDKIDRRLAETDFATTEEYVIFVLEAVLRELEGQNADIVISDVETGDSDDDTDVIQKRLESLGYL